MKYSLSYLEIVSFQHYSAIINEEILHQTLTQSFNAFVSSEDVALNGRVGYLALIHNCFKNLPSLRENYSNEIILPLMELLIGLKSLNIELFFYQRLL